MKTLFQVIMLGTNGNVGHELLRPLGQQLLHS